MNEFIGKISEVINNSESLRDNKTLLAVVENVKYEGDELSYMERLNEGLSDFNKYAKDSDINSIISSVATRIDEAKKTDIDGYINKISNKIDIVKLVEGINSDENVANPVLKGYLYNIIKECKNSKQPSYLYLHSLVDNLNQFKEYSVVKESIDTVSSYLNENMEKLVVIDTLRYLRTVRGTDKSVVSTLKACVFENQFNPDVISIKLGGQAKHGAISQMLESLRAIRSEKTQGFDLGSGNNGTSVYNYVGPVLKEGSDLTFCVGGSFIKVTPNRIDESLVKRNIHDGSVKVYELDELSLYNTDRSFYNTTKAFESLGFRFSTGGLSTKLSKTKVDVRINESMDVDLYLNESKVSDISKAKSNTSLLLETNASRSCLFHLMDNMKDIYNLDFVKFVTNESKSLASMVINLGSEFVVYDYVNEKKTDVYKLDAVGLCGFVQNKFGYDISKLYKVQLSSTSAKAGAINEKKDEVTKLMDAYSTSIRNIEDTLKKDIRQDDVVLLENMRASIVSELDKLKESYISLCSEHDACYISEKVNFDDELKKTQAVEKDDSKAQAQQEKKDDKEDKESDKELDKVNENDTDGTGVDTEFKIPDWAVSAILDMDNTGVSDEQKEKIKDFALMLKDKYGDSDGELELPEDSDLGFCKTNDIDSEPANCVRIVLKLNKVNESTVTTEVPIEDVVLDDSVQGSIFYNVPSWASDAMDKNDFSSLSGEQVNAIVEFGKRVESEHADGEFISTGEFVSCESNDVDGGSGDCVKYEFIPKVNESWLGDAFRWVKGKSGAKDIESHLKKFKSDMADVVDQRMELELNIELLDKANKPSDPEKKQMEALKNKENAILKELAMKVKEVVSKNPSISATAERLRAGAEKEYYQMIKDKIEELKGDVKYKNSSVIVDKMKKLGIKEKEINDKITNLDADIAKEIDVAKNKDNSANKTAPAAKPAASTGNTP